MRIVVQPTFPGRRRNSPCADTLCSDLSVAPLPTGLFIADEAGITVTVDGGSPRHVRAMTAIGADGEFDDRVYFSVAVPGLGTIELAHAVGLSGTVAAAITGLATDFAVGIAEAAIDADMAAELVVLDHSGATHLATTC